MTVVGLVSVLVIALLLSERLGWRSGIWLAKPLASAGFVSMAVRSGALDSDYGSWVLVGLIASWFGDVLLIPASERVFKLGVLSFIVAHLSYSIAFLRVGADPRWVGAAALPLLFVAIFVGRLLIPGASRSLRNPVRAYIAVISAMLALGVGAWAAVGHWAFLAAPLAFYLSDLAVARNRFVHPGFINRLIGLPLYYAAQLLFGWSVSLV